MRNDIQKSSPPALADILSLLRDNRDDLQKVGVRHADVFDSVARGEQHEDSDIDILVDLDPDIVRDLFAYSRIQRILQNILGHSVDIAQNGHLRTFEIEAEIVKDAINVY